MHGQMYLVTPAEISEIFTISEGSWCWDISSASQCHLAQQFQLKYRKPGMLHMVHPHQLGVS